MGGTILTESLTDLVTSLCADVLGMNSVSPEDDFFALGGDSLQAMLLASRLSEAVGGRVRVRTLFEHSQLRRLAEVLLEDASRPSPQPVEPIPGGDALAAIREIARDLREPT